MPYASLIHKIMCAALQALVDIKLAHRKIETG